MKLLWVKGKERLTFNRPLVYFSLGQIGSGKSSLLESIACEHLNRGSAILDCHASADGENLA